MNLLLAPLRGLSQIFFISSPWTGLILLLAVGYASPRAGFLFLLGSVVQTVTAHFMGLRDEAADGLQGYNGALVGAAAMAHVGSPGEAILLTILGALACVPVHQLLATLFSSRALSRFALPVLTAPFCIIATGIFTLLPATTSGTLDITSEPFSAVAMGISNSFAEVDLEEGWIAGVIVFVGLIVGSRAIAAFGLAGAVIGVLTGLVLLGPEHVSSGLLSYSSLLAAAGIGAVIFADRPLAWRAVAATAAALLTLPFVLLMSSLGSPVLTWPFVFATWIVVAVVRLADMRKGDTPTRVSPSGANA